jgi:hypothetical protein
MDHDSMVYRTRRRAPHWVNPEPKEEHMYTRRWATALASLSVGLASLTIAAGAPASAQTRFPDVTVRMTILELLDWDNDLDDASDTDFYVMTSIDDRNGKHEDTNNEDTKETEDAEGEEHIYPNWEIAYQPVNPSVGKVDLTLVVKDEDGFLNGKDDTADVIDGGVINIEVSLRPCQVRVGTTVVGCGQSITQARTDRVRFKIDVVLPASAPGLRIQCLHEPLWPQPGDIVTITAAALDGKADSTEIFMNYTSVARAPGAARTTYSFAATGDEFWYECITEDNGGADAASTGPRMVRVGPRKLDEITIPLLVTGSQYSRIDVVVVPDQDSYPGGYQNPQLVKDLHDALLMMSGNPADQQRGLFANEFVLTQQQGLNIRLATSSGDADNNATNTDCELTEPENWDDYSIADAGWIMHRDPFRDCAELDLRLFSSEHIEPATSVHEMGHVPFGLADEYCCDGGYFEAPNLTEDYDACDDDAQAAGLYGACRFVDGPWFTSDPKDADVMGGDRTTFNRLDRRRWNSIISDCIYKKGC